MKKNNRLLPDWKDSGGLQQVSRMMKCVLFFMLTLVCGPGESVFPTVYTGPTSETNFSGRSFQPDRGPDRTEIFVQYPAHRLKRESGCRSPAGRHPQSAG